MIRINLIPPEILQARKDEALFKWVWLGGAVVSVVLVLFWGVMFLQVMSSTSEVAGIQAQANQLQAQTSRFSVFQAKESELNVRRDAVAAATKGRIDWTRMLNELGLVLPSDVYLTSLTGNDNAGGGGDSIITLAGKAADKQNDSPDNGYKSIARMLVRLADMQQLDSVWLTNMSKEPDADDHIGMLTWSVNAKISTSSTATIVPTSGN